MQPAVIFVPIALQVWLTAIVWIYLFYTRIGAMRKLKVSPDGMANNPKALEVLKLSENPSDNLENLFEMPILFFVGCLVVYGLGAVDWFYMTLAILYVVFRAVHSFVHCTSNRIPLRFWSYIVSCFFLWVMWIKISYHLFHMVMHHTGEV